MTPAVWTLLAMIGVAQQRAANHAGIALCRGELITSLKLELRTVTAQRDALRKQVTATARWIERAPLLEVSR